MNTFKQLKTKYMAKKAPTKAPAKKKVPAKKKPSVKTLPKVIAPTKEKEVKVEYFVEFEMNPDDTEDTSYNVIKISGKHTRSEVQAWAAGSYGDRKYSIIDTVPDGFEDIQEVDI